MSFDMLVVGPSEASFSGPSVLLCTVEAGIKVCSRSRFVYSVMSKNHVRGLLAIMIVSARSVIDITECMGMKEVHVLIESLIVSESSVKNSEPVKFRQKTWQK